MTPSRWARIKEIFVAARELPAPERPAFLDASCEPDLREEVDRLLAEDSSSLVSPVLPRDYKSGDRIGQYCIESKLGQGGMGVVYKARDTRLGRDVAIKLSTAQFSGRFEREARAVAALNHAHI